MALLCRSLQDVLLNHRLHRLSISAQLAPILWRDVLSLISTPDARSPASHSVGPEYCKGLAATCGLDAMALACGGKPEPALMPFSSS